MLVISDEKYMGTGRMLADGHVGRLAVLKAYRGRGLGAKTVQTLVREAQNSDIKRVYLGAQKHTVSFYEKLGFAEYGEPYIEANIEHIRMERFI